MPRHALPTLIGLSLLLATGAACAQDLYQWKDANGITHYSQTPPASGSYTERTESGRGPARPVETAAAEPAEPPQCATSRANIALLESESPVQQDTDGDGEPDRTLDRKSTRLNSSHSCASRMPSSACKKKQKQRT